uniref:Uncharacterized protein n=1 Tax=Salix viminalis TaxID=40686 RepID=A0A6N2M7C4_SALVM
MRLVSYLKRRGGYWKRSVAHAIKIPLEYIAILQPTYDAMGRCNRDLGACSKAQRREAWNCKSDFEDEKSRLAELLKEAGRARNKKAKSLENLIDPNSRRTKKESTKKWGFRI